MITVEGLLPAADHLFSSALSVKADLDGDVRVRVPVVKVPPLMFLVELDQNFLIIPRRGGDIEVFCL